LITKTDFQGNASGTATVTAGVMTIPQAAAGWNPNQFFIYDDGNAATADPSSHYVEIISDGVTSHEGLILDIKSNAAGSVDVYVPSGYVPGASITYAIRKHATLSSLFPAGSGLVDYEDIVALYNENGVKSVFELDGGAWIRSSNGAAAENTVIYPGQGMVITCAAARTILVGGTELAYVKNTNTRVPLYIAPGGVPNIVGIINPLVGNDPADSSPVAKLGLGGLEEYADIVVFYATTGQLTKTGVYEIQDGVLTDSFSGAPAPSNLSLKNGSAVVITVNQDRSILTSP
jgi:hypothetical protein